MSHWCKYCQTSSHDSEYCFNRPGRNADAIEELSGKIDNLIEIMEEVRDLLKKKGA